MAKTISKNQSFLNDMNAHYGRIHNELKQRYAAGQRQDAKYALELERLFNYLVYNHKTELGLNKILTKEIADRILKRNPKIGALLRRTSSNASVQGARGEEGFARLIIGVVEEVSKNPSSIPLPKNLVSGQQLVTVLKEIPTNVGKTLVTQVDKKMKQKGQQEVNNSQAYAEFQQKTDVSSLRSIGNFSMRPGYEWLLELASTIKNYTGTTISVGNTSRMKIMRATITNSKSLNLSEKTALLNQLNSITRLNIYNNKNFMKSSSFQHFQHIQAIYELIGFGQGRYEDNVFKGAELPRFLMVNIQNNQRIVIRSTRQLVSDILKDSGVSITASGTRFKF